MGNKWYKLYLSGLAVLYGGMVMGTALTSDIDMKQNYIEFDQMTASESGSANSGSVRLFCNEDNNSHLSIKRGSSTVVDLEGGGSGANTDLLVVDR